MNEQTAAPRTPDFDTAQHRRRLAKTLARRSFATVASTSAQGNSHVAGVVYVAVDNTLWVHTMKAGRKAKNIAQNSNVAVCVPFRRLPVGPPYTIHFQAEAELVELDAPEVLDLVAAGRIKKLTGHNALEMDGACFLKITPTRALHSYGPGVPVIDIVRDPLTNGGRSVSISADAAPARR